MKRGLLPFIVLFTLTQCAFHGTLTEVEYNNNNRLEGVSENSQIEAFIAPYRATLDETMNKEIATLAKDVTKAKPESLLGNLLADATREMASIYMNKNIDVGVVNYGGIRLPQLNEGPILLGTVYEVMPFDNYVVVLEMTGSELKEFADAMAARGGWPISGMTYIISDNTANSIMVGGLPLDLKRNYRLAISDYVANGGDKMSMLKTIPQINTNMLLRDAFIEYFKMQTEGELIINPELEGRVSTNE